MTKEEANSRIEKIYNILDSSESELKIKTNRLVQINEEIKKLKQIREEERESRKELLENTKVLAIELQNIADEFAIN